MYDVSTLLAVAPWVAGAALHGFARSQPASSNSNSGQDTVDASNETGDGSWDF